MNDQNVSTFNYLDRIRTAYGNERLKALYNDLVKSDPQKAANLLNDSNLHFCSLFVLKKEVEKVDSLNSRNKNVLNFIDGLYTRNDTDTEHDSFNYEKMSYSDLKWIINTGYLDDGLNNEFDEILDIAAAVLIKIYEDKSILEILADMIFKRNRKGLYFYDLVWILFESNDPMTVFIIINRLCSNNSKDIELARKFLSFISCGDEEIKNNILMFYKYCYSWFQENSPFLYYTGESFQQTNNPRLYEVSLQAKYLCKPFTVDGKLTLRQVGNNRTNLTEFNKLGKKEQGILADFSYHLYRNNFSFWNIWIRYPIKEQIRTAKMSWQSKV